MASSSTPSSITTLPKKHEVFLSFRGEDTRHGLTSHLYDALCRKQIETFIDDDKLERGDEISSALLRAIQESKIAVVIFSENYASSKWCLRELVEIIKCMKMNKLIVMPVFYDVDPSDVRKQTGSFERSFANYEEIGRVGICSWFSWLLLVVSVCLSASVVAGSLCFLLLCLIICRFKKRKEKELQEEAQKWRKALTEASNQSGWNSSVIRPDSKLVGDIVKTVWIKLRSEYIPSSRDFEGLIGIHKRIEKVMALLCLDMEDVRKIIGIWGMGGIGKTTIAQAVFKFISYKFDGACIIEEVGKILEEKGGLDRLKRDVLSIVLHEENPKLDTPIRPFIMEMFNQKKVFIVLDDVNHSIKSKSLFECLRQCGLGSRIIITSRDKQVFCDFDVDDHKIYKEKGLDDDEALELFCEYANPTEDFMALSKKIVNYAKGNPLALKVLGSSLKGKSKSEWESALDSLQGIRGEIFDVLKISYDGLEEKVQNLFLDIACFEDLYRNGMLKILDEYSLSVLIAKSLLTIDEEGVEMHDLLQEMGKEIVRRESLKTPGKRSRLWEQDDVIQILENNTGTDAVEVISLDMDGPEDEDIDSNLPLDMDVPEDEDIDSNSSLDMDGPEDEGIKLSPQVFDNMYNLRFLLFYSFLGPNKVHLSDSLNCLPNKLMVLHWPGYPSRVLPLKFNPKQLVKLDLSSSNIEQFWERTKGTPKFPNLKWLILSKCTHLTRIPNLSDFPMLEEVDLRDCNSLVDLTCSVRQLENLRDLDLSGCQCLTRIPNLSYFPSLEKLNLSACRSLIDFTSSVQQLNKLRNLNLRGCINVTKFPLISGTAIETLNLQGTAIEEVPSSIQSLTNLSELDLSKCTRLKHISQSICKLKSLSTLDLTDCSKLEIFPEILETMESLKSLKLRESAIKVLPPSIERLNGLRSLTLHNCENLEMLPSSICNLSSLEELNVCNCSKLDNLPENLGNLKSLKCLNVSGSAIGLLPSSITRLENLEDLDCSGCSGLTRLPLLSGLHSLQKLCSNNCSLMKIPEDIDCLSSLKELKLRGNMFESLPKSIKQLSKLEFLSLGDCKMLRSLPELPAGLEWLEAMDCDQLCQVPDASEFLSRVQFMFANSFNLEAVSNVFEESLRIIQRKKKGFEKSSNAFSGIYLLGDKIPKWFSYHSLESSVNIKVRRNDLVNRKFMGIAICSVLGFAEYYGRSERYTLNVFCDFEIYHDHIRIGNGLRYGPTHILRYFRVFMDSEHMFLGYCSFSSFYSSFQNPEKLPISDSDYLDISIKFKTSYGGSNGLKCCAVHPIYAEEPLEIIGATIQETGETSGRRSDRSNDNDEAVEPHPKRICTQAIKTP